MPFYPFKIELNEEMIIKGRILAVDFDEAKHTFDRVKFTDYIKTIKLLDGNKLEAGPRITYINEPQER